MSFDYVERFSLFLNDLNGSMKLPPGKYTLEDCLGTFFPWKFQQWKLPYVKIPPVKIALQQIKKSFKSKIIKIKASGIGILQKSVRVYQNYFRS